jgi:hypothetical protein
MYMGLPRAVSALVVGLQSINSTWVRFSFDSSVVLY